MRISPGGYAAELDSEVTDPIVATNAPVTAPTSAADVAEQRFRDDKAREDAAASPLTRQRLALILIGAGLFGLLVAFLRADVAFGSASSNRLGVSTANVFLSDSAAGAAVRQEDYVPASSPTVATPMRAPERPSPSSSPTPTTARGGVPRRAASRHRPQAESAVEVLFDESDQPAVVVPAIDMPGPVIVNVGERFAGKLLYPIVTGGGSVPVTAALAADIVVGGRTAMPAGTRLVGEAFATTTNDRAQIVFHAAVIAGRTLAISAVAFDEDNQLGVIGKLVKKGSALKKIGGRLAGAFGGALSLGSYGLVSPSSMAGTLSSGAAADIQQAASDWVISSKVIEVPAEKRLVVYLSGDLTLGAPTGRSLQ